MDMSIYENIKAGKYKNQVPYPKREDYPNKEKHYEALKQYRLREHEEFVELFKKDVLEAYGLSDHPKAQRAFEIAWSNGHSAGYHEVLNWFDELSELLK